MSSEHIERQMAFIIDQQAKFSVDIAELKERIDQLIEGMVRVDRNISRLTDALLSLTNIVERHDEQIAALVEQGKDTDARMKETDARLNALIEIVERHISGHG